MEPESLRMYACAEWGRWCSFARIAIGVRSAARTPRRCAGQLVAGRNAVRRIVAICRRKRGARTTRHTSGTTAHAFSP